jgi:site-specific DNA-methyltransferase (adenine-specific)
VLHDGCRLCVNIGDQFARSSYYGRYKVIPIRTEIIRFCETIGFDYMGAIIWQKVTTCNTTGGATVMGSFPHPRNGILKLDYEFILLFKKRGKPPTVSRTLKKKSALTKKEWNAYFHGHWNFAGERQTKHLAAFPLELPRRLIKMFTFLGETVLDPFIGSGTTALAAHELSRSSIGYEIDTANKRTIRRRLAQPGKKKTRAMPVEFVHRRKRRMPGRDELYLSLPYLFTDPTRIERKESTRGLTYGSKVDTSTPEREQFFRIKTVSAPHLMELDVGVRIRLLGVRPIPNRRSAAMKYLRDLVKGERVYLKYDSVRNDKRGRLLCYLYLANRTFINTRLIREGFARLDEEYPLAKQALFRRYTKRKKRKTRRK